ncbi:MAG: hypothetical protein IKY78_09385 [Clostridia bacterium]|nr:hypothetical protein [Clostridia bacterium]
MVTRLRLKGRILLADNVILISLLMSTTAMLLLCINFLVPVYELFMRSRVEAALSSYTPLADIAVGLLLFAISCVICLQIRLGTDRYFLRQSQKKGSSVADIFYYFHPRRAASAIAFSLRLGFIRAVWLAVSVFPCTLCIFLLLSASYGGVSYLVAVVLAAGTVTFLFSGLCFYRSISDSLFLAKYHFISGDCLSFRQMISASQEGMKNKRTLLLRLRLSFTGWLLLSVFILPAGYVWGYYSQTLAVAANEFIEG